MSELEQQQDSRQDACTPGVTALDSLGEWVKTHDCNTLGSGQVGETVILMGWVLRRRDHGGLIFVDLRDREGLTQVVFDPQYDASAHEHAHCLRSEFVIAVSGKVRLRPEGMANPKLRTGEIEVIISELKILNVSKTPPFQIEDEVDVNENVRLKYRYLDLRRPGLYGNLLLRHRTAQLTRGYFNDRGFIEVETPVLTRSTRKAPGTISSPAGSTPESSTPCPSRRNSSSSFSWCRVSNVTTRS